MAIEWWASNDAWKSSVGLLVLRELETFQDMKFPWDPRLSGIGRLDLRVVEVDGQGSFPGSRPRSLEKEETHGTDVVMESWTLNFVWWLGKTFGVLWACAKEVIWQTVLILIHKHLHSSLSYWREKTFSSSRDAWWTWPRDQWHGSRSRMSKDLNQALELELICCHLHTRSFHSFLEQTQVWPIRGSQIHLDLGLSPPS